MPQIRSILRTASPAALFFIIVGCTKLGGDLKAPVVATAPASTTVTEGQTASFSVAVQGTAPFSYQWLKNGAAISGAKDSSYVTPATKLSESGTKFSVKISNDLDSVTSAEALLTVNPAPVPPSISTQPSPAIVTAGQTASFTVVAAGTAPLAYQWKKNGTDLSGATAASYTTPATALADNGSKFAVKVSNVAGNITSNEALLTVNPLPIPPSILTQPQDQSVGEGKSATFAVEATGTAPLSYQWKRDGQDLAQATDASYSLNAASLSDSGAKFAVKVSNPVGNITSREALLTVKAAVTTQVLSNPGFEDGFVQTAWTITQADMIKDGPGSSRLEPHGGVYYLRLNGIDKLANTHTASQEFTVPADATEAKLSFWWTISNWKDMSSISTAANTFKVELLDASGTVLATLLTKSNLDAGVDVKPAVWAKLGPVDLLPFKGKALKLLATGVQTTVSTKDQKTGFYIDDCEVSITRVN